MIFQKMALGRALNCPKGFIFGGASAVTGTVLKYSEDLEHRTTPKMGPLGRLRACPNLYIFLDY